MRLAAGLAALLLLLPPLAGAQALTPLAEAGRRLYHEGIDSKGRPVAARVTGGAAPLRGQAVSCGNCHGEDGRGRPESGVDPGDVTWSDLTKPSGHRHANGRLHGPYDAASFRRAMRDGIDPGGHRMDPAMPLYDLPDGELDALVAYLGQLETQRDPGLSADTIRIGTLLPTSGRLGDAGTAVRKVLEGHFAAVNERGGVHGRKLLLVVESESDDVDKARAAARTLVEQRDVFALLSPLTARLERAFLEIVEAVRIPVVGPLTLFPEGADERSLEVFHLLSGVPELAEVLAAHQQPVLALSGRPVVLLHADSAEGRATAGAVATRLKARGYGSLHAQPLLPAEALAARLKELGANAVVVLATTPALTPTVKRLVDGGVLCHWLLPAPLVPPDILAWPSALNGRVMVAYPSLATDRTPAAMASLRSVAGGELARNPSLQVAAMASSLVLVEALSRAGREVSRKKLIAALESLQNFETGLTPPVRYGAGRRVGVYGGYVVTVDFAQQAFRPLPDFVRLQ